ncbi:putative ATPase [Asanoa ferruginea]|uniref:Putative ATPase n=1 Tax=Asanoa ferruginea TaxID=53367 RepID=A0A3D9ZLM5_9ACTN|nr:DUF4062 domain-containing protein [Asanoa ferruginea]REF98111.1 putative ATPase [Asanoa ferruginea]GIF49595.1 hypothetical protein Afe04nite_41340 [Asanoa ferruginea]
MASSGEPAIHTPDRRLRVFVSSTLEELEPERLAVRDAIARMRLVPVMFELGARPHGPREVYRAYLEQSQLFIGIYWESYGWVGPDSELSGIEDEYLVAAHLPKLIYVKAPAPDRDPRLTALLDRIRDDARVSYRQFRSADELRRVVGEDIALLLTERFNPRSTAGSGSRSGSAEVEAAPRDELPVPPNPLLGRRAEQRALRDLLTSDDVRLVTLTGPGGVGKTRLAMELGSALRNTFADGVRFTDLSGVTDPDLVAAALAQSLGLRTVPNRPPLDDVVTYLRNRSLLLVVDNLEHLPDAAPIIATVLGAGAGITMLATSRVPLRLTGEHVFDVLPLPVPDPAEDPSVAVRRDGAARLFVERARAVKADFSVGPDEAAAIAEIVRRLDGLPLAVELAAAKVRVLSPRALLSRLTSRLGTLTGGARDLPARQRTLRDTIAWSYQLLPPHEQRLFGRLGVFAGPFDLTAARSVAGVPEQYAGLDALTSLIESSLIGQERGDREPRFTMLGIIRDYALERLREDGDWTDTHNRHALHYLYFAEHVAPPLGRTSTNPGSVDLLEAEHDNLRAAMSWFIDTGQFEEAVRLGWVVWSLWWLRGHTDEGARSIERVLEHADQLSPRAYARVLFGDGSISFITGQHAVGKGKLERALPLLRQIGDDDATARAAGMLGQLALARGDYDQARELLEETKQISERLGEDWMIALYHTRLGLVPLKAGDPKAAAEQFSDGLRLARKTNDHLGEVVALYSLAVAAMVDGDRSGATAYLESGLRVAAGARDEAGAALYLRALSNIAARTGSPERAVRLAAAARKLQTVTGAAWIQAYVPDWPAGGPDLDIKAHPQAWSQGTADNLGSALAYALEVPQAA